MSDLVSVAAIKDLLAECPICTEEFDETTRIPRRMPCCVQSVCQPCLETYSRGRQTLSCPLCRHQHHLPGGVKSLPKEHVILNILDHLKIQKGLNLPCTDCPDKLHAVARCGDCGVFLCKECLNAHTRALKDHTTFTFEEMKGHPVESFRHLHQCREHQQRLQFYCHTCNKVICVSCTVVDHKEGKGHNVVKIDEAHQEKAASVDEAMTKLEDKIKTLSNTLDDQTKKEENIKTSKKTAENEITKIFDNLMEELQQRRAVLLSEVEARYNTDVKLIDQAVESTTTLLTRMKSSVQYIKEMRFKADKIEDLMLMVSSQDSLNSMLTESLQDVEFDRSGISFVPANVQQLTSTIKATGLVRSVRFSQREVPSNIVHREFYNNVTLEPAQFPQVADFDALAAYKGISFPNMEWDTSTAGKKCKISGPSISNTGSESTPTNTGCRLQGERHVLASEPLIVKKHQRILFQTKITFFIKRLSPDGLNLFEIALTNSIIDAQCSQHTGLSVRVFTCSNHKQNLCLKVWYDNEFCIHAPVCVNKIGEFSEIHLCFLIDGSAKIHVINAAVPKLIHTITDFLFVKPLWVKMYVDVPTDTSMTGELISGKRVTLSAAMDELIRSL